MGKIVGLIIYLPLNRHSLIVSAKIIPVSLIMPTAHREEILSETLKSLCEQNLHPSEIIIVDASDNCLTERVYLNFRTHLRGLKYVRAKHKGAAVQRNQGIELAINPFIAFFDDDIILEAFCLERMWLAINSSENVGGVNALIVNQKYHPPGKISKSFFRLMNGKKLETYAGLCIGPACNLLPEDNSDGPELVVVGWLNSTCTIYRRVALPSPVFDTFFTGYSFMEDLTLSLRVGKNWELLNVAAARIYHHSQPGSHKNNVRLMSKMELVNRHYVMVNILNRSKLSDYIKLLMFEMFGLSTTLFSTNRIRHFLPSLIGKFDGIYKILLSKARWKF